MYLGQEYHIAGNWFIIHFTENNGMAFGMELFGKKFLSLFRIGVMFALAWYVWHLHKTKAHHIYTTAMALIFAGAVGNIIDSIFYGRLFPPANLVQLPLCLMPVVMPVGYMAKLQICFISRLFKPTIRNGFHSGVEKNLFFQTCF